MTILLEIPLPVRLALLAFLGAGIGSLVNFGIYALAYDPRAIGPWSRPVTGVPDRRRGDFLPVVGWFGLRREADRHGAGFWIRPALIELAWIVGLPWLYWRCADGTFFPEQTLPLGESELLWAHGLFVTLAALLAALCIATFIDFDEKTIPDWVTIPGTLVGLALSVFPYLTRLPIVSSAGVSGYVATPLWLTSPAPWPKFVLDGSTGLAYGLAIYAVWCLALANWYPPVLLWRALRRNPRRAARKFFATPFRGGAWIVPAVLAVIGGAGVIGAYAWGGAAWQGLLSALIGLAFGGGLIWAIRIVASLALGEEAMGFGDVTLMAMVGAFLGWQPAMITFFLAPFAAVIIAMVQVILTRRHDIAFGPYLSLGAATTALFWAPIWEHWASELFRMGLFIPQAVGLCILLMGGMLVVWRGIKNALGIDFRRGEDQPSDRTEN